MDASGVPPVATARYDLAQPVGGTSANLTRGLPAKGELAASKSAGCDGRRVVSARLISLRQVRGRSNPYMAVAVTKLMVVAGKGCP